jgi:hypothetical protein
MILADHRHEAYATARAAGYSQTESAKRAGYPATSAPNAGHRLEKQEPIKRRVAELLATERQDVGDVASRAWIICNLVEIVRTGTHSDTRDLSNANRALEALAKIQGHMVERKESYRAVDLRMISATRLGELLRTQLATLPPSHRDELLAEMDVEAIELIAEPIRK